MSSCVTATLVSPTTGFGGLRTLIHHSTKYMRVRTRVTSSNMLFSTLADQTQEAASARFARHWPNYTEDMWSDRLQIIKLVLQPVY